ncbi:hypothetical protein VTO42DRAFT_4819 [Malbranchea cinnamomea]
MVIADRLGKGCVLAGLRNLDTETVAKKFIRHYVPHHGFPLSIISDLGSIWISSLWKVIISSLWKVICRLASIQRRLSTAWYPETDGGTERLNVVVEAYIRHFTIYAQDNWYSLLPMVVLHIAARPANATGLSPFLLTYGWEVNVLELFGDSSSNVAAPGQNSPEAQEECIVNRLRQALEWAQASMAAAQEDYECHANAHRTPAPVYKPGDKVWFSLCNIHTDCPSKKLDAQQAQFTVLEQRQSDYQPPPIIDEQGDEEWEMEYILSERIRREKTQYKVKWQGYLRPTWELRENPIIDEQGDEEWEVEYILSERIRREKTQYKVKWRGYLRPTWELRENLEDTAALDVWEASYNKPSRAALTAFATLQPSPSQAEHRA